METYAWKTVTHDQGESGKQFISRSTNNHGSFDATSECRYVLSSAREVAYFRPLQ